MLNTCKFCLLLLGFVVYATTHSNGESSTCLTVYKEGGAPAVFQSPKCPRWKISNYASGPRTARCQSAMRQGRRRSQEDRSLCVMDVRIPFPGQAGLSEVTVGLIAVFDGHNGAEASELASKLLLEYFMLHAYFLLDTTFSILSKKSVGKLPNDGAQELILQALNWNEKLDQHASDHGRFKISSPKFFGESLCLEILKESLLRAIHDIDATFSKEASRNNLDSGSTATVVLIADGQILVANVGDSKALLCSEEFQSRSEAKANLLRLYRQRRQNGGIRPIRYDDGFTSAASGGLARFTAKVLTRDHHPDRDDERSRVESAGGNVLEWAGVSRVNGQLAVSRAIGDVSFKSYGVISAPEVTDWQLLTANDSYLVASSDGIFEKMTPQEVCDLLWELHIHGNVRSELAESCSHSLADCIVDTALEKGSTDNMAAVVVPLTPTGFYEPSLKDGLDRVSEISNSHFGVQKFIDEEPELNHAHPFMAKFDRLLVEGRHNAVGCFYLSENLSESADHTFWVEKVDHQFLYDPPESLPDVLNHYSGGPLNLYNDQNMCLHLGMAVNEDNDKCINPEGFVRFLGLLESIPVHNTGPDYGSPEHDMPDSRYILKKRFGRGAFGEVWLAFHWNCTAGVNASNWNLKGRKFPFDAIHINSYNKDSQTSSSSHEFDYTRDGLFILKRIMVEKGAGIYLSGLREKYFGEVLLNASMFRRGFLCAGISETFSTETPSDSCTFTVTNESVASEMGNTWNFGSVIVPYEEGLDHIARYVESFESRSGDMWLVFRHEGVSLSKLLYTAEEVETSDKSREEHTQRIRVLYPSKWWRWLKTTNAGQEELRSLIRQLLMAIKSCHDRNITHRDIKPENMVICFEDQLSGRCLKGVPSRDENYTTEISRALPSDEHDSCVDDFGHILTGSGTAPSLQPVNFPNLPRRTFNPRIALDGFMSLGIIRQSANSVGAWTTLHESGYLAPAFAQIQHPIKRIIDFGSAMDEFTLKHLYGSVGPSRAEQTYEYTPPEALLNASWYQGRTETTLKYDMWSAGVVILELILGSPDVFQIGALARALLDRHLEGWNEGLKELAHKLRAFMELCILIPGSSSRNHHVSGSKDRAAVSPASWKCSEEYFSQQIKSRDPLKIGFPDVWALRLVRQLLAWDPDERLSVDDALRHRFFQPSQK